LSIVGLSDGDPIDLATDQSSAGDDGTQTGSNRPIYKTGILNGLPVMRFNGTDQWLNMANSWPIPPATMFVVWNCAVAPPPSSHTDIASSALLGSNRNGLSYSLFTNVSSELRTMAALAQNQDLVGPSALTRSTSTWYATGFSYDGTSPVPSYYRGRPTDPCTDGNIGVGITIGWGLTDASIGATPLFGSPGVFKDFLAGDLAALLAYDRVLGEGEKIQTLCYLSGKYALGM